MMDHRTSEDASAPIGHPAPVCAAPLPYIYRWDRQGRKSQACSMLVRGTMNSCLVEFSDGYRMVTSRNAIKKNPAANATGKLPDR
jgi:hypothetical protein